MATFPPFFKIRDRIKMRIVRLQDFSINPLRIASAFLIVTAPFAAWMTLSVFGFVVESNLWSIARSETNFPISSTVTITALFLAVLLIVAGLISLKRPVIGLPIAFGALLAFFFEAYSSYGTFSGGILVSILPGLGFFMTLSGIILGLGSLRGPEIRLGQIVPHVLTETGLAQTGLFVAAIGLAGDGWNHWSADHLPAFMGLTGFELVFHRLFLAGVSTLVVIMLVRGNLIFERMGGSVVLILFSALMFDVIYHFSTNTIVGFIGDNPIELLLHSFIYYGTTLIVIARFLLRPSRSVSR